MISAKFLTSIGCPTRLSALGIGDTLYSQYAQDAVLVASDAHGNLPGHPAMSGADIIEVLKCCLVRL